MKDFENKTEKSPKICDNKSVGMIIRKNDDILLIERMKFPFGFAPPAGHIDDHGSWSQAVEDEVNEEVGLIPVKIKLLVEGRKNNKCRRQDGDWHYWKIYEVETAGEIKRSEDETKQASWYSKEQIRKLADRTKRYLSGEITDDEWENNPGLEVVWYEWFDQLGVLTTD
ncbi:hypothetical protein BH10PAT1_BH10PAT1_4030 [soil metagenome]